MRETRRQAAHMGFELVAVGVQKVERVAFTAIAFPFDNILRAQLGNESREVWFSD